VVCGILVFIRLRNEHRSHGMYRCVSPGAECPSVACPASFPYPDKGTAAICYNDARDAAAGAGPCGSWCTLDPKVRWGPY
jgi:hypothetical protein